MARTTKQLSGSGKDKFLRAIVDSVDGVDAGTASALGERLCDTVTEVRVRREVWDDLKEPKAPETRAFRPARAPTPKAAPSQPKTAHVPVVQAPPAFDPFAFSAVAVYARKGKSGLAAELARITSAEDLHTLSVAQHLAIDPALTDPASLREAIVAGVERRIAERKAAAT